MANDRHYSVVRLRAPSCRIDHDENCWGIRAGEGGEGHCNGNIRLAEHLLKAVERKAGELRLDEVYARILCVGETVAQACFPVACVFVLEVRTRGAALAAVWVVHTKSDRDNGSPRAWNLMPLLIPRMLMSINQRHIQIFCSRSLVNVCRDYDVSEQHPTVQCMSSIILCEQMSYTDSLALFFLLLNIDCLGFQWVMREKPENFSRFRKYTLFGARHIPIRCRPEA